MEYLRIRQQIPEGKRAEAEKMIEKRIFDGEFYLHADCVYCYVSFRDEVNTHEIILESLRRNKKVAVPRVTGRREMEFYYITSVKQLRPGYCGIREPAEDCAKAPYPGSEDLVIVPGAVFDRSGNRIGYGGGYYDAYFRKGGECMKTAPAFSEQIVESVPSERHDLHVDIIITEKELIQCSGDCLETR